MRLKINRGYENKFYTVVIIFVFISFFIFFTSKWWMYDDNPIKQTPFYTEIGGLDQTKIILKKWEYNPEKELMEVMVEMKHDGSDTVKPTFAFAAKESKTLNVYPVDVMYQDENNTVIQIKNVPNDYKVVGLFVREKRDPKILESELQSQNLNKMGTLDQDGNEVKVTLPKPAEKIIVGDYRKIKINTTLEKKDKIDYQIEQINIEIKQLVKQIHLLEKEQIPLQDGIIKDIEKEIKVLESDMEYKTEGEKQDVRQQIVKKKDSIEKAKEKQNDYSKQANDLREKRLMLLAKVEKLKPKKE